MAIHGKFLLVTSLSIFLQALSYPVFAESLAATSSRQPVITISKRNNIRVVYDVGNNETDAGVGRALYYIRGVVEAYRKMGLIPKNYHMHVVVHGAAGFWLLNDENFRKRQLDPFGVNPNEQIIQELQDHGVSIELCSATMQEKGWAPQDLLPGVKLVHDAYSRIIDLQMRGYAYIYY
jgi:uncharacterized protein